LGQPGVRHEKPSKHAEVSGTVPNFPASICVSLASPAMKTMQGVNICKRQQNSTGKEIVAMSTQTNTTVRMFGALHTFRRNRGLQSTTEVHIPPSGCAASDLAANLDLPLEKIEGVFVNHRAHGLITPSRPETGSPLSRLVFPGRKESCSEFTRLKSGPDTTDSFSDYIAIGAFQRQHGLVLRSQ